MSKSKSASLFETKVRAAIGGVAVFRNRASRFAAAFRELRREYQLKTVEQRHNIHLAASTDKSEIQGIPIIAGIISLHSDPFLICLSHRKRSSRFKKLLHLSFLI